MDRKVKPAKGTSGAAAQQLFYASVLSMSWQLLIVFLIPVVIGYLLDRHFKTAPWFVLIGMVVAVVAAVSVVWRTVREVNRVTGMSNDDRSDHV